MRQVHTTKTCSAAKVENSSLLQLGSERNTCMHVCASIHASIHAFIKVHYSQNKILCCCLIIMQSAKLLLACVFVPLVVIIIQLVACMSQLSI